MEESSRRGVKPSTSSISSMYAEDGGGGRGEDGAGGGVVVGEQELFDDATFGGGREELDLASSEDEAGGFDTPASECLEPGLTTREGEVILSQVPLPSWPED